MGISLTSFSHGSIIYCSTAIILTLAFDVDSCGSRLCACKTSFVRNIFYKCRIEKSHETNLCHTETHTHILRKEREAKRSK